MKTGRVSEAILKRSVLRTIHSRREEVITGPAIGSDAAELMMGSGEILTLSADPVLIEEGKTSKYGVYAIINDLAASGAETIGILVSILLPEETEEQDLKNIMKEIDAVCQEENIAILGGHTGVTRAVAVPVLNLTGVGRPFGSMEKKVRAGQDIVLTKWIGLEATAILAEGRRGALQKRFSDGFIDQAASFTRFLSAAKESRLAVENGVSYMHDISEGGVFGALWEIGEAGGVGLDIHIRNIPIKQETIEICEQFDMNPYEIISGGSLLMVCDNGEGLVDTLAEAGIHAAVIGQTTDGKERILRNQEEIRYLDKPKQDQIWK